MKNLNRVTKNKQVVKSSWLSMLLLSVVLSCSAQKKQERPVSAFSKLEISGAVTVFYTQSDTLALSVKSDEDELDRIETKVINGTLFISSKGRFDGPAKIYIKNNQLQSIELSGASEFKSLNTIKADSIDLNVSGASDLHLALESKKISCRATGASNVNLSGSTGDLEAQITSASTLKAYKLNAKNARVTTTGASSAKVLVNGRLLANANGASDIKVKGDPTEIVAESTSASSITRIVEPDQKMVNDSMTYVWKKKKIIVVKGSDPEKKEEDDHRSSFKHWRGFSMGVNGYMSSPGTINIPTKYNYMDLNYGKSYNFQFNLIERQFNLYKNNVKLITGLGFDYHSYALSRRTILNPDSSFTSGVQDSSTSTFSKNRLRATYIQVPLLFEFNTSNDPDKTFHFAIGVIGQYLIASRTKQIIEDHKDEYKKIRKDAYNLSPFAAKAHVDLGYRAWTFFGEYSLTSLFQPGKGPDLYPFTVGLRVIPFG